MATEWATTPRKVPMTPQKGMTRPAKIGPRWAVNPRGVAGMKLPVTWVKSTKGMGISWIGLVSRAPEIAGIAT